MGVAVGDSCHDFCKHFRLADGVAPFFARNNKSVRQLSLSRLQRALHFVNTGRWINEHKVCVWAAKHPEHKISSLFEDRPIHEKLVCCETYGHLALSHSRLKAFVEAVKFIIRFLKDPQHVGAILPSSPSLAKEIASQIPKNCKRHIRILEIGPGTGAFTPRLIRMGMGNVTLHLVEYDKVFARNLRRDYGHLKNVQVFHRSILDHTDAKGYDVIISGLPLNGFSVKMVEDVFAKFKELSAEGATLSYFDYRFLPFIKSKYSKGLRKIMEIKNTFFRQYGVKKANVMWNFPLARVMHHRLDGITAERELAPCS